MMARMPALRVAKRSVHPQPTPVRPSRFSSVGTTADVRWYGEFARADLEERYIREEVAPILPRRCTAMALVFCILMIVYIPIELATSVHANIESRVFMSVACVFWAVLLLAARAAARGRLAIWKLEWLFAVLYGCISSGTLLGYGGLLGWLDAERGTLATVLIGDFWNNFLQQQCVLMLIVIVTPLRARVFALMLGPFVCAVLVTRVHAALSCEARADCPEGESHWIGTAITSLEVVLFSALTLTVCGTLNATRRHAHDFYRSVEAAAAERAARVEQSTEVERERALAAAEREKADAASQARSRLIRVVMHDLRSPLLSVVSSVDKLKRSAPRAVGAESEGVQQALTTLTTCSRMMEDIIQDMLDFERISSGRLKIVRESFMLAQLVDRAREAFSALAEAKGVRLSSHVELPLLERVLVGDARRLQQCVNKLCSNALKFTERGGTVKILASAQAGGGDGASNADSCASNGSGHSSLGCAVQGPPSGNGRYSASSHPHYAPSTALPTASSSLVRVSLRVVDSGVGLSAEQIAALHGAELFTQVGQGQLQGSGGSGLGLIITRQLLQLHDGSELRLHSDGPNRGTTAELALNLRQPEASSSPLRRRRFLEDASARRRQLSGVLTQLPPDFALVLVDDDESLRQSLPPRLFGPLPFETCAGGDELLARLVDRQRAAPALIVIDSYMPRLSGAQSVRLLREAGFTGKVIGLSTDPPESPERLELEAAGCNAVMTKDARGLEAVAALVHAFTLDLVYANWGVLGPDGAGAVGEMCVQSLRTSVDSLYLGTKPAARAPEAQRQHTPPPRPPRASLPPPAAGAPAASAGAATHGSAAEHSVPAPAAPVGAAAAAEAEGARCLYAEDDPFLQLAMADQLFGAIGAPYDLAENGAEALERVRSAAAPYDVIVLDNQMPKLTGQQVVEQLRAAGCQAAIIGLTGDPKGSDDREAFEAAGLDLCADKSSAGVAQITSFIRTVLAARAAPRAGPLVCAARAAADKPPAASPQSSSSETRIYVGDEHEEDDADEEAAGRGPDAVRRLKPAGSTTRVPTTPTHARVVGARLDWGPVDDV